MPSVITYVALNGDTRKFKKKYFFLNHPVLTQSKNEDSVEGIGQHLFRCYEWSPQESSLGPLIFVFFVSDLQHEESNAQIIKYADDIFPLAKVFKHAKASKAAQIYEILAWTEGKEMKIKESKCRQMFVVTRNRDVVDLHPSMSIPSIQVKERERDLSRERGEW